MTSCMKNDTCGVGSGCDYFMKICFSLSNNNCSLGKFTTKSWKIKPGENKTFSRFEQLAASNIRNPYVGKTLDKWRKVHVKYLYCYGWADRQTNGWMEV